MYDAAGSFADLLISPSSEGATPSQLPAVPVL